MQTGQVFGSSLEFQAHSLLPHRRSPSALQILQMSRKHRWPWKECRRRRTEADAAPGPKDFLQSCRSCHPRADRHHLPYANQRRALRANILPSGATLRLQRANDKQQRPSLVNTPLRGDARDLSPWLCSAGGLRSIARCGVPLPRINTTVSGSCTWHYVAGDCGTDSAKQSR